MDRTKLFRIIKAQWVNVLLLAVVLVLLFHPDAKAWMLQRLFSVGLFKAEIKKDEAKNEGANSSFFFTNAEGKRMSTAELKGKVVVINFWASWCPPCRAEMPSLQALYNKLKNDDRYVFLFINEDDDKTKAIAYLEKNKFTFPVCTSTGTLPGEMFNGTLPTTIVLNKEGMIVFKKEGVANYNTVSFLEQLQDLL